MPVRTLSGINAAMESNYQVDVVSQSRSGPLQERSRVKSYINYVS